MGNIDLAAFKNKLPQVSKMANNFAGEYFLCIGQRLKSKIV